MAERMPLPAANWEQTFEAKTDLARMVVESRRRRHAAGDRFLSDDEIDVVLGRADDLEL